MVAMFCHRLQVFTTGMAKVVVIIYQVMDDYTCGSTCVCWSVGSLVGWQASYLFGWLVFGCFFVGFCDFFVGWGFGWFLLVVLLLFLVGFWLVFIVFLLFGWCRSAMHGY